MSVVLSFERKRAHVYPHLRQVRLFSALGVASGTHYSIRWIPSELNPSDLPSRQFEKTWQHDLDKDTAEQDRYGRSVLLAGIKGLGVYT